MVVVGTSRPNKFLEMLQKSCWDILLGHFLRGTYLESGDQGDSNGIYHKKCPNIACSVLLVLTRSFVIFLIFELSPNLSKKVCNMTQQGICFFSKIVPRRNV